MNWILILTILGVVAVIIYFLMVRSGVLAIGGALNSVSKAGQNAIDTISSNLTTAAGAIQNAMSTGLISSASQTANDVGSTLTSAGTDIGRSLGFIGQPTNSNAAGNIYSGVQDAITSNGTSVGPPATVVTGGNTGSVAANTKMTNVFGGHI
jgi:hypothetical protein